MPIRSFGLMVLIGFLCALWYAMAMARRRMRTFGQKDGDVGAITPDNVFDVAIYGLFLCILGARLLYILLDLKAFREHPLDVFRVWEGGISIHGALISGILWLWWYCRRKKLPYGAFADIAGPSFGIGYAFGRIGCFLNGCCYGHACDLPWAVQFHDEANRGALTPPSHPTQLYATLMTILIVAFLHRWNQRPHRDGEVFLGYLMLYCVYRFIDEQFRKGATADIFMLGMTHAQFFSVLMLPILLVLFLRVRRGPIQPGLLPPTPKQAVSS